MQSVEKKQKNSMSVLSVEDLSVTHATQRHCVFVMTVKRLGKLRKTLTSCRKTLCLQAYMPEKL